MVTYLENARNTAELAEVIKAAGDLMSLTDGVGFRQISGIEVVNNITTALHYIDTINAEKDLHSDEKTLPQYIKNGKITTQSYIDKTEKAISELEENVHKLLRGCEQIKGVISKIQSECDML